MNLKGITVISTVADAHYGGGEVPDMVTHPKTGEEIGKTEYKRLDGWRGYWEVRAMPGWRNVGGGCHCGDSPDVPSGTSTKECEAEVSGLAKEHGEVVVVLCGGSNVCALQYDVLARETKTTKKGKQRRSDPS